MMGFIGMGNNPMVGDIDAAAVNCAFACSIYATCAFDCTLKILMQSATIVFFDSVGVH